MKQYYIFFVLIFPLFVNAQVDLSVSPSPDGEDSYVYVNNEILFVTKGINLEKNNNSSTEASIYLRSKAQLLQGDDIDNSGDGYLSVFQEGTSNAFDYNYWGMPVVTTGKKLNQILYEPIDKTASRPVQITSNLNGSANPLTISSRWIYKFSGLGYNSWQHIGNNINQLAAGLGFSMKGTNGTDNTTIDGVKNNPGSAQRYDFRGIPNNGNITLNIDPNKSILVGNPYPSAIDLDAFLKDPDNDITGIAYFWDSEANGKSHYLKDYEGGYGAYSPGAGGYVPAIFKKYANQSGNVIGNAGENGAKYNVKYLPIGAGFNVIGNDTGGTVTFKNSHRIYDPNTAIKLREKSAETGSTNSSVIIKNDEAVKIRLNVNLNDTYTRQLLVAFNENATVGPDKAMDAPMFGKLASDASFNIEEKEYMINVLPFDRSKMIPLNIVTVSEMEVDFSIDTTDFLDNENIYLYDSENNRYTDIKKEHYKLQLNGDFKDRFFIAFENDQLTEEEKIQETKEEETFVTSIDIFQNNNEGRLQIVVPKDVKVKHVAVYNLNAGAVINQDISTLEKELSFSTTNLMDAIYIVQIKTTDNRTVTKKITVKN